LFSTSLLVAYGRPYPHFYYPCRIRGLQLTDKFNGNLCGISGWFLRTAVGNCYVVGVYFDYFIVRFTTNNLRSRELVKYAPVHIILSVSLAAAMYTFR
jgi:hypothetical protein